MPSCAAGPVSATDWPSTTLSLVTPFSATAHCGSSTARAIRIGRTQFLSMRALSDSHVEEFRLLDQAWQVPLLPRPAFRIGIFGPDPGCPRRVARARLQLRGVAQPERAVHQERAADAEALADEQQAGLLAHGDPRPAEEGGEIDHAVEIAADIGDAPEPRAREGHRADRRDRNHLAGIGEVDQPAFLAYLQGQLRSGGAEFGALQPGRQLALVIAQRGFGGHQPRAAILASRSA